MVETVEHELSFLAHCRWCTALGRCGRCHDRFTAWPVALEDPAWGTRSARARQVHSDPTLRALSILGIPVRVGHFQPRLHLSSEFAVVAGSTPGQTICAHSAFLLAPPQRRCATGSHGPIRVGHPSGLSMSMQECLIAPVKVVDCSDASDHGSLCGDRHVAIFSVKTRIAPEDG